MTLHARVALCKRQIIIDTLTANNWRKADTARELGIDRSGLYRLMKQLGIASYGTDYLTAQIAMANLEAAGVV